MNKHSTIESFSNKNMDIENLNKNTIEEILDANGVFLWSTKGTSMRPLLKTNRDVVEIRRPDSVYENGILKVNDIALYKIPAQKFNGQYVLHRIRKVCNGYYILCGDNNLVMEHVPFDWVIGVMTGLTRKGRNVDMNGIAYKTYVMLWGSRYRRRVIIKRIVLIIKKYLRRPYRALRKIIKRK